MSIKYYEDVNFNVPWDQILKNLGYTPQKKENGDLIMRCIFHKERTPSLVLYRNSFSYHCHGCNCNGDKFNFVERFLGRSRKRAKAFFKKNFNIDAESYAAGK